MFYFWITQEVLDIRKKRFQIQKQFKGCEFWAHSEYHNSAKWGVWLQTHGSDFSLRWSDFRYPRSETRPRVPEIRPPETEIRPMGLKSEPPFHWIMILWMCPKFTSFNLFLDLKSFFSNIKYFLSYSKIKYICLNQRPDFRPQRSDFRPTMPGIRHLGLISVPKGLKMDP